MSIPTVTTGDLISAADWNSILDSLEVDGTVGDGGSTNFTSETTILTTNLTIPAGWSTWVARITATGDFRHNGGVDRTITLRLKVDGSTVRTRNVVMPNGTRGDRSIHTTAASQTATGTVAIALTGTMSGDTGTAIDSVLAITGRQTS